MAFVYLPEFLKAEYQVAARLVELHCNPVEEIEHGSVGLLYNQPEAVLNACTERISIVTGCAGTGKTTTLRSIIDAFEDAQLRGAVCSPTGKAAKRAHSVINDKRDTEIECLTAHRLLGCGPFGFKHKKENPLDLDYVIIDEFSMCDLLLFNSILQAINPKKTRLILCGDPFQLPSVGPGNVARDLISAGVFPVAKLNKIIRQGAKSGIVFNSHRILRGEQLSATDDEGNKFDDFFFVESPDEEKSAASIITYVTRALKERRGIPPSDVQVIAPGKKGKVGVDALNDGLRAVLNPEGKEKHGFRVGDRVINTKNNYKKEIVNGDMGYVRDVTAAGVEVEIDGGKQVSFAAVDLPSLRLAYAFTIHKSQGSEFRAVVYPLHTSHYILHSRNLLYTGVTRGKEIVVLIGDKKSLARSIKNNTPIKRCTRLKELIQKQAAVAK